MPYEMRTTGSKPTRRVLLVVLLAVSFALMVVFGVEGEQGPLHSIQSAVMNLSTQATGATAGIGVVRDATAAAAGDATANPETLSELREQNEELRRLLAEAEEYRQEVDRLRGLLDMKQVSGVTGPVAHIIGRSSNAWDQSITIDAGSNDGVRTGMTIMGATGVIGQVARVTDDTATVRLLTDPNSGAAVMIQSSRENGIVHGSINGLLYLEDLDEDVIPEVGDVIITSGLGGSYERGLIVGAVVAVNKTPSNPMGTIIVNPNDSARALEEVIVVTDAPDVAAAEADASAAAAKKAAQEAAENGTPVSAEEGSSSSSSSTEESTVRSTASVGDSYDTTATATTSSNTDGTGSSSSSSSNSTDENG